MSLRHICFSHGKESGPWGTKIRALADVGRSEGWSVDSLDYQGMEDPHTGDGIMASFAFAPDAVECSIAIQKAFAAYNQENPNAPLYLLIGLSAGEPIEEHGDLFGKTVQLAALLCAHAEPARILVAQGEGPLPGERISILPIERINAQRF